MLELTAKILDTQKQPIDTVELPWEKRLKSRLRVTTASGRDAGIFLPRGTVLRGGDFLTGTNQEIVAVLAAPETVSTIRVKDSLLCARLCYHLGNRHIALEISLRYIRYLHDHVLDDMVRQLGGTVEIETAPFEPEYGAYSSGHGHSHHHG